MASHSVRFYEFGLFRIDLLSRVLLRDGRPLPLEPKVFDTLLVLVENHTRVVSKDELMKAVWGADTFVEEGSLTRNVSLLRKTLAEGHDDTLCIATFPKRGYQFVAPVRKVTGLDPSEPAMIGHGDFGAVAGNRHPQGAPLRRIAVLAGSAAVLALALGYRFVRPLPAPVVLGHQALSGDGREKRGPLVTDGRKLYFEEKVDGKWGLTVVPTSGGELSTYSLPSSDITISDIAPDGSELIGWENIPGSATGRLLVWPTPNGPWENLAGLHGTWPAWSPERGRIAYSDGIHSLFVAGRGGESPRKVASVRGRPQELRWSPDGKSLRFSQRDPTSEISSVWEVLVEDGQPYPLLTGWKHPAGSPAWADDGTYSLFTSVSNDGPDIWARRENCNPFRWWCREPTRIAATPSGYRESLPSRDGKKLFVMCGHHKRELARFDMKSGKFAPYLPNVLAADLDFSPDGKWIAYVQLPQRTLWRSRPDGSNASPLIVSGAEIYSPHWSPDGKQIAYMAVSAEKQYKACVVPAEGGPPRQFLPGAGEEGVPTWSRDGNFVIFGDVLHGLHASEMAIHLLDIRNQQSSELPGSNGLWAPRWSPSGRYIAALSLGDEAKGNLASCPALLLYDVRTSNWTTLANVENIRNLAWSRDGQYAYFHTGPTDLGLYRVNLASRKVERLASLKGFETVRDDWIGVAPDGSPLIIGDTQIDEVYSLDVQWP